MSRSVWKGPFVDGHLLRKAKTVRESGRKEVIRIWSRRSTILPQFVGLTFGVHNGQKFLPVLVTEDMAGLFPDFTPRFVRRYADLGGALSDAAAAYARDVRERRFPGPEHCFGGPRQAGPA